MEFLYRQNHQNLVKIKQHGVLETLSIFSVIFVSHLWQYRLRIPQHMNTYLLSTLESDIGDQSESDQVLVRVDQGVSDGDDGRVVESQGDCSNGSDTREEAVQELGVRDIQNVGSEDVSVVEDLDDAHSVGERRDV